MRVSLEHVTPPGDRKSKICHCCLFFWGEHLQFLANLGKNLAVLTKTERTFVIFGKSWGTFGIFWQNGENFSVGRNLFPVTPPEKFLSMPLIVYPTV